MSEKIHEYRVDLKWKGNKKGEAVTEEGLSLEIGAPPEFGGTKGVWSPENLIVASLNSCFTLTFMALVEKTKLEAKLVSVSVRGILTQAEDRRWSFTRFLIQPKLKVQEQDREKAKMLLEKAEKYCLISQSLKAPMAIEEEWVG